jgi:mannose-6-phosphate isomerase-like protein (cupin superfamily)
MQVVLQGGETNRHAHTGQDAAWLVLEGRARFYGKTDDDVFELNPMEGLFIPDGADYWFESASDKPLKILRMSARDPNAEAKRLNYSNLKEWQGHLGGERAVRT